MGLAKPANYGGVVGIGSPLSEGGVVGIGSLSYGDTKWTNQACKYLQNPPMRGLSNSVNLGSGSTSEVTGAVSKRQLLVH